MFICIKIVDIFVMVFEFVFIFDFVLGCEYLLFIGFKDVFLNIKVDEFYKLLILNKERLSYEIV